jgi:large subunit ribosomal protein L21
MAEKKSKSKEEPKAQPKAKGAKESKAEKPAKPAKAAKAPKASKKEADAEPREPAKREPEAPRGRGRFAVIQAQGLQLRVGAHEEHILPHLGGETGDQLKIDRVLLVSDGDDVQIGTPLIEGAVVTLQVVGHEKGEKIEVGTYKRRKKYRRKIGYRDTLTRVKVLDISLPQGEKRGRHGS